MGDVRRTQQLREIIIRNGEATLDMLKALAKGKVFTAAEYRSWTANVQAWLLEIAPDTIDAAFRVEEEQRKRQEDARGSKLSRMWRGNGTLEEQREVIKVATRFASDYPQLDGTSEANGAQFEQFLKQKNLDPREYDSWVRAFTDLAIQGRLVLIPKNIGLTEEAITGRELATHRELYKLLDPYDPKRVPPKPPKYEPLSEAKKNLKPLAEKSEDEMSAAEYRQAHPELQGGLPPLYIRKREQVVASWLTVHPEYRPSEESRGKIVAFMEANNLPWSTQAVEETFQALLKTDPAFRAEAIDANKIVTGKMVRWTENDTQISGSPYVNIDCAFRRSLQGMPADEYKDRLLTDSEFRARVEALD